jgi:hypothetical protein
MLLFYQLLRMNFEKTYVCIPKLMNPLYVFPRSNGGNW